MASFCSVISAVCAIPGSLTHLSNNWSGCRFAAKGKGRATKVESGVPFKPANPMKQAPAAQAGTFYGSIGGIIRYEPVRPSAYASLLLHLKVAGFKAC